MDQVGQEGQKGRELVDWRGSGGNVVLAATAAKFVTWIRPECGPCSRRSRACYFVTAAGSHFASQLQDPTLSNSCRAPHVVTAAGSIAIKMSMAVADGDA